MQVLRDQSYLAISPSTQKVTLLRNLIKEKHRNLAFVQQMTVLEQKKALHKHEEPHAVKFLSRNLIS